jgi:hypothetical protein
MEVERTLQSRQADVSILGVRERETGARERVVMKLLRPEYVHNSPDSLRTEFQALRALGELNVRSGTTRVVFPRPIEISAQHLAFLMRFVEGVPLDEHVHAFGHGVDPHVPRAILEGLHCYHRTIGNAYGDFHPGNLVVGDEMLGFLDPTMANPTFERTAAELGLTPAAADLGYWLYWVTVNVRRIVLRPLSGLRLLALTARLLGEATINLSPERRATILAEVRRTAGVYLRPLLHQRVRNVLQFVIASLLGAMVTRMADRHSRRRDRQDAAPEGCFSGP